MSTPNVKVVSVLPGWWRIVALFGAGVGLVAVSRPLLPVERWLVGYSSATLTMPSLLLLANGVLVALSFSEQRLRRSCYEAVAVGTGLTVGRFASSPWNLARTLWIFGWGGVDTAAVALDITLAVPSCLVIRLLGLWSVRSCQASITRTGRRQLFFPEKRYY